MSAHTGKKSSVVLHRIYLATARAACASALILSGLAGTGRASEFYVSPTAGSSGDGSLSNPWTIAAAFQSQASAVKPGDTIWLRGGTYGAGGSTSVFSYLSGSAKLPIYVRQYPGERATINGGLGIGGNNVWFWGFEVANLNWPWPRSTSDPGSFPGGKPPDGIFFAQGVMKVSNGVSYNPLDAPVTNTGYYEMDANWNSGMNLDLSILNNVWVGATPTAYETLLLRDWQTLTFKGNTVVGPVLVRNVASNDWSGDIYYNASPPAGIDSGSAAYSRSPTGYITIVRPNKFEPGRANIVVLNWDKNPAVSVDISPNGLPVGTQFEVRDSQNFWGTPVLSGTYDGSPLALPMVQTQVSPLVGGYATPPHTSAEFNAFILLPKGFPPVASPQASARVSTSSETFRVTSLLD